MGTTSKNDRDVPLSLRIPTAIRKMSPSERWLWGALVVIVWLGFPYLLRLFHGYAPWSVMGTIGDSYGALNSIMSTLAFGGLVLTILLQAEEAVTASARHEQAMASARDEAEANRKRHEDELSIARHSALLTGIPPLIDRKIMEIAQLEPAISAMRIEFPPGANLSDRYQEVRMHWVKLQETIDALTEPVPPSADQVLDSQIQSRHRRDQASYSQAKLKLHTDEANCLATMLKIVTVRTLERQLEASYLALNPTAVKSSLVDCDDPTFWEDANDVGIL